MTLELMGELLGLGSIVRVENEGATGLFVVLARGGFRPDKGRPEVVPRYLVGPHPYGEAPDQETLPILATDILTVVHHGYTDAADAGFLTDLLDQMEYGKRTRTRARQFTDALTEFPKATASGAAEGAARARVDPFVELRGVIEGEFGKGES